MNEKHMKHHMKHHILPEWNTFRRQIVLNAINSLHI